MYISSTHIIFITFDDGATQPSQKDKIRAHEGCWVMCGGGRGKEEGMGGRH